MRCAEFDARVGELFTGGLRPHQIAKKLEVSGGFITKILTDLYPDRPKGRPFVPERKDTLRGKDKDTMGWTELLSSKLVN